MRASPPHLALIIFVGILQVFALPQDISHHEFRLHKRLYHRTGLHTLECTRVARQRRLQSLRSCVGRRMERAIRKSGGIAIQGDLDDHDLIVKHVAENDVSHII